MGPFIHVPFASYVFLSIVWFLVSWSWCPGVLFFWNTIQLKNLLYIHCSQLQVVLFTSSPPNFSNDKISCKELQNFSKCQNIYRDFVLREFRGDPVTKKHPVDFLKGVLGHVVSGFHLLKIAINSFKITLLKASGYSA